MSILGGGLDLIHDWDGWPVALTMVGDAILMGLAAWLAYAPTDRSRWARALGLVGAIAMGAIAFWLVGCIPFSSLFAPRNDQLAWALALTGLVLVPIAARGSRGAAIGSMILLSLGWWTKQPAILASAAAIVWLILAAWRGENWRRSAAIIAGLTALGIASFGIVHLATDGWSTTFIIDMPADRARPTPLAQALHDLRASLAPAAVVAAGFWLAAVLGRDREVSPRHLLHKTVVDRRFQLAPVAGILVLFIVLDAPAAVWFRQAQGSVHNQFVGMAWALGLLAALGWSLAQRAGLRSSAAAAGIVIALFALTESPNVIRWMNRHWQVLIPPKEQRGVVFQQPPALVDYAQNHLVYHPIYPGIGASREADMYPGQDNVTSLTWSGRQPGALVRALLDRRFDIVYLFFRAGGTGRWEANYIWKLNQVIKAKYRQNHPSDRLPPGLLFADFAPLPFVSYSTKGPFVRRPGPDPAPWMAHCFGPFEIEGVSWRIVAGGGFWCRPGGVGDVLTLVRTPAPMSEIRADSYEAHEPGEIRISALHAGTAVVDVGGHRVTQPLSPRVPALIPVPAGSRGISIEVSAGSGARVDLSRLGARPCNSAAIL